MDRLYKKFQGENLPPVNGHPEMDDYKPGEVLMVAKLDLYSYNMLNERVKRKKMEELLEEPSSYEDEDEDDGYNHVVYRR